MSEPTSDNPIVSFMDQHDELIAYISEKDETSFQVMLGGTFPKVYVLAGASWMEHRLTEMVIGIFSAGDAHGVSFVRNAAVRARFHSWFDWNQNTPNKFFALFGPTVASTAKARLKSDPTFAENARAFMELGSLRNQLVHGNYAAFGLQKTAQDVRTLFMKADAFLDEVPGLLALGSEIPPEDDTEGG